jgi:hypothetical protein
MPAEQVLRKRMLVTILCIGSLAGTGYGVHSSLRHLEREAEAVQESLDQSRDLLERALLFQSAGAAKPRQEILSSLDAQAGNASLRIESLKPLPAGPDGSSLRVDLALRGTLPAFGKFMKACAELSGPPGIEELSLSAQDKGGVLIRLSLNFPGVGG